MRLAARASRRLGLTAHATFSGALAWPYAYPWPQRPAGLIETAFDELARRWRPILDAFDEAGVDVCYEIHPGEDLFDGATFEMFLDRVGDHPRCNILYDPSHFVLQQLDYLAFIDIYHPRIRAFHAKDAEFNPTGPAGRLFRLRALGGARRPLPLARRRAGGFRRGVLEAQPIRLRRLGGAGMGVLHQGQRAGRGRGRALHRLPHHPRWPTAPSTTSRRAAWTRPRTAPCSASRGDGPAPPPARHGGRRAGRLHRRRAPHRRADRRPLRARRRRLLRRSRPGARQRRRAPRRAATAPTGAGRRWRRAKRRGRTAWRWWRSSRRTTCTRSPRSPSWMPASMWSAKSRSATRWKRRGSWSARRRPAAPSSR